MREFLVEMNPCVHDIMPFSIPERRQRFASECNPKAIFPDTRLIGALVHAIEVISQLLRSQTICGKLTGMHTSMAMLDSR
jgi:hypothetical protein